MESVMDFTTWFILGAIVVLAVGLLILRRQNPRRK